MVVIFNVCICHKFPLLNLEKIRLNHYITTLSQNQYFVGIRQPHHPQQKEPDINIRLQAYTNNYKQLQVTANNYVIVFQSKQPCSSQAGNHSTATARSAILPMDFFLTQAMSSEDTSCSGHLMISATMKLLFLERSNEQNKHSHHIRSINQIGHCIAPWKTSLLIIQGKDDKYYCNN